MPSFNFSPYLPENSGDKLRGYVYRAEDRSLIYQYFWRPFCRASVERLPVWLAPNVITVSALVLVILVHVGFAVWMPDVTLPSNTHPSAVAKMSVAAQQKALDSGVPFFSAEYEALAAIFRTDAEGSTAPPAWLFIAGGVCLILYQYLDNMDGHQARRTGMSSPLGLLMDHGCDAVNTVIGTLSVASVVCLGPTWKTWSVVSSGVIVFFCNTWEEYYRGALILPIVNGANEGILMAASIYFFTAVVGPSFWLQTVSMPTSAIPSVVLSWLQSITIHMDGRYQTLFDLIKATDDDATVVVMLNSLLTWMLLGSAVVTCLGNFYQVRVAVDKKTSEGHGKYGSGWLLRTFPYLHALTRLIPLAAITVFANVWMYTSPANIFRSHARIACWTFGLLYTKLAVHLMIAHLCSTEFHPFRRTLIPFLYCGVHALAALYTRYGSLASVYGGDEGAASASNNNTSSPFWGDERMLLVEFFVISAVTYAHLTINIVIEMATELKVPVFTVPAAKQKATLAAIANAKKAQ